MQAPSLFKGEKGGENAKWAHTDSWHLAEARLSPGLTINLSSNNPFRNRAASPASLNSLPSPQSPRFDVNHSGGNVSSNTNNGNNPATSPRAFSRNPFLDVIDNGERSPPANPSGFPMPPSMPSPNGASSQPTSTATGNAAELFVRHLIFSIWVAVFLEDENLCLGHVYDTLPSTSASLTVPVTTHVGVPFAHAF